jgi:hypothetical protein
MGMKKANTFKHFRVSGRKGKGHVSAHRMPGHQAFFYFALFQYFMNNVCLQFHGMDRFQGFAFPMARQVDHNYAEGFLQLVPEGIPDPGSFRKTMKENDGLSFAGLGKEDFFVFV